MHPDHPRRARGISARAREALRRFPREFVHWAPPSWDGVPSEPFTAIEQICHVRDIEIEGYQVRFRRTLDEDTPLLPSIDSETVAKQRDYGSADPRRCSRSFTRRARETLALLRGLDAAQFAARRRCSKVMGP